MKMLTQVVRTTRPNAMLSATHGDASKQGTYPSKWSVGKSDLCVKGSSVASAASAARNLRAHKTATVLGPVQLSVRDLAAASMNTTTAMLRCSTAS